MNYTKGWRVGLLPATELHYGGDSYVVYRQDGDALWDRTRIADCYGSKTNAHLIAEAPQLCEIVKYALLCITQPNSHKLEAIKDAMELAIAKVEG